MKIWLVTTELYPFSGGIGVYAHHAARMFARGGHDVSVLFHDGGAAQGSVAFTDGYRLIRFSDRTLCGRSLDAPELQGPLLAAYRACELLKQQIADDGAPDVIEFQDYGALGYFFLKHRLLEMGGEAPRVVLTAHRPYAHCAAVDGEGLFDHRTAFLADCERWCFAAADAVLAPCRFIVDVLARPDMGFPSPDVQVVRNPFDAAAIAEAPEDPLVEPARLELTRRQHGPAEPALYFGKLQNQKGGWDLLAALAALDAEGQPQPLWMWGRDALHSPSGTSAYDFLETRYARLFRTGGVRYFGDYGLGAVRALCATHPVCVLPYREECLPYAFIEVVLAGGLPLISPAGGQIELIPEAWREPLSVDFTRPDQVGERIAWLKALDPPARRRLSDALKAEVARQTGYDPVLNDKLAALARVALRSTARDYPFVHGEARRFAPIRPEVQTRLADAVPQRGRTISTVVAPGARPAAREGLVSVIIPYHEMHAYIDETLASVEAQTYPAVEVVIVDDGSHSEAAKAKLNAILRAPRRFRTTVLRKYNAGLADARNAGAKAAEGQYLYFLDADDLIHPAMLAQGLRLLDRFANVSYVGAWLREFEGGERTWMVWDIDGPYLGFHNLQVCGIM